MNKYKHDAEENKTPVEEINSADSCLAKVFENEKQEV